MANVLVYVIIVNKFSLQSLCNVHFRTNFLGKVVDPYPTSSRLKTMTTVFLEGWLCFHIISMNIDMPLNKETESNNKVYINWNKVIFLFLSLIEIPDYFFLAKIQKLKNAICTYFIAFFCWSSTWNKVFVLMHI